MQRASKKRAKIAWEGDSLDILREFPDDVRKDLGFALDLLQQGRLPANSKPMTSIGSGVFELKEADERAWYRVIYLAKIEDTVYVLHSFEKQSAKTSRNDLETAEIRLKRVLVRIREAKK